MKIIFKKQQKTSISVIRAVNRIKGYRNKKTDLSILYNKKSTTYPSIIS